MRAALSLLVFLCVAWAMPAKLAAVDDSADQVLRRTFVPSPDRKVGEVRLLRRGDTDVVQTLLYTKILKRVVGEIRKKETANWLPGSDGYADSLRYIDALVQAQEDIWSRLPKFERSGEARQKLLIEFILDKQTARVVFAEFDFTEAAGTVRISARRALAQLDLSRAYVRRNMQLIVADSFQLAGPQLQEALRLLPSISDSPPHP